MMPVVGEAHVAQIFVHVLVQQVHRESVHGGIPVLYIRMCVCFSCDAFTLSNENILLKKEIEEYDDR